MKRFLVVALLVFALISSSFGWVVTAASYRDVSIDPITYFQRIEKVSLSNWMENAFTLKNGEGFFSNIETIVNLMKNLNMERFRVAFLTFVPVDWLEVQHKINVGEMDDFYLFGVAASAIPFYTAYNVIQGGDS